MTMRITDVVKLDNSGAWTYTWEGTAPFAVYRKGRLVPPDTFEDVDPGYTTNETTRTFTDGTAYEPPQIEVLDSTDSYDPDNLLYPAYLVLQWHEGAGAEQYRIDRYIDAAWTTLQYVAAGTAGYYTYETPALVDGTAYQYRIVPITAAGDELTPIVYTATMVTLPEPPAVTMTVAAGVITVAARV
jgi:hypothetical protein